MDAAVKRRPRFTTAGIPLPRIDQRTIGAMRYRTLLDSYCAELGGHLSEPEKALVQQIASMQLRIADYMIGLWSRFREHTEANIQATNEEGQSARSAPNMPKVKEEIDLESAICDIADMANVCVMVMDALERNDCSIAEMAMSAKAAAEYLAYWREMASFSVLHLKGMTIALKKQFYASAE
jgi:hypothetical protein